MIVSKWIENLKKNQIYIILANFSVKDGHENQFVEIKDFLNYFENQRVENGIFWKIYRCAIIPTFKATPAFEVDVKGSLQTITKAYRLSY